MKYLLITILFVSSYHLKAQNSFRFNQLDSLQNVKKKNVVVFLSANWCNYCKAMEEVVFNDPSLASVLNDQYYFIKLNAEDKTPIVYKKQKFKFNASLGYHQLALALSSGKLIFPSIYMINNENEIIYQHQGFINAKNLLKVLPHN